MIEVPAWISVLMNRSGRTFSSLAITAEITGSGFPPWNKHRISYLVPLITLFGASMSSKVGQNTSTSCETRNRFWASDLSLQNQFPESVVFTEFNRRSHPVKLAFKWILSSWINCTCRILLSSECLEIRTTSSPLWNQSHLDHSELSKRVTSQEAKTFRLFIHYFRIVILPGNLQLRLIEPVSTTVFSTKMFGEVDKPPLDKRAVVKIRKRFILFERKT